MSGFVYLVCLDKSDAKLAKVKIGLSSKTNDNRIKQYGSDAILLRRYNCNNYIEIEQHLISGFANEFTLTKGNEYFEGPIDEIEKTFDNIVHGHDLDVYHYNIDIHQLAREYQNSLSLYEANRIYPSEEIAFNLVLSKLKLMLPEYVYDTIIHLRNIKDCIDFDNPFIISSEMLQKARISISKKYSSEKFQRIIKAYDLIENIDFKVEREKRGQAYGQPKKIYSFSYCSFVKMLISSHNMSTNNLYRDYYLLCDVLSNIYSKWIYSLLQTSDYYVPVKDETPHHKPLTDDQINDRLLPYGIQLKEPYGGSCDQVDTFQCLSILNHTIKMSYSVLLRTIDQGCVHCRKIGILDYIPIYVYDENSYDLLRTYDSYNDLVIAEPHWDHWLFRDSIRKERWLQPYNNCIYSILSPVDGKFDLMKSLTDVEAYIITKLEIDFTSMRDRLMGDSLKFIIAIDEQTQRAYSGVSNMMFEKKLMQLNCARSVKRKSIAKYLNTPELYGGYKWIRSATRMYNGQPTINISTLPDLA